MRRINYYMLMMLFLMIVGETASRYITRQQSHGQMVTYFNAAGMILILFALLLLGRK